MTTKGIKIVSDGTVMGTRVFTEDGDDVTEKLRIKRVEWRHEAGAVPEAVLTCVLAQVEASVEPSSHDLALEDITNLASKYRERRKA